MATTSAIAAADDQAAIDLRNPALAALLAWLIPGAGHLYQGRTGKGLLYLICILGTFIYGLYLGGGKVVYFAWQPADIRSWAYFCQVGVGLAALPALVQAQHQGTFGSEFMAPPLTHDKWVNLATEAQKRGEPAADLQKFQSPDELAWWHRSLNRYYDLGLVYTMIAGLLNVLAIYDAYAGPVPVEVVEDEDDESPDDPKMVGASRVL